MSLPSYLANIKSSGIYRFVWDKSEIAGVDAEILRLVVGYSEVGPFNTPVYVRTDTEFKKIFGGISKKMEKRGIFFHRLAIQSLAKGPILALNIKKFSDEKISAANFNVVDTIKIDKKDITSIYDITRFWKLDPNKLQDDSTKKYIALASTDSKESSCTVIMRGYTPTGFDVTLKSWYSSQSIEMPDYMTGYDNMLVSDFFAEIYVFKGQFTKTICAGDALSKYFDIVGDKISLKPYIINAFGEKVDTLAALASDESSNFINVYRGILLPEFKNALGSYISLDLLFNADNEIHHLMMDFNNEALETEAGYIKSLDTNAWDVEGTGKSVLAIKEFEAGIEHVMFVDGQWGYQGYDDCFDADKYKFHAPNEAFEKPADESKIAKAEESATDITYRFTKDKMFAGAVNYLSVNIPQNVAKGKLSVEISCNNKIGINDVQLGSWSEANPELFAYTFTKVDDYTIKATFAEALPKGIYPFVVLTKVAGVYDVTIKADTLSETILMQVANAFSTAGFVKGDRFEYVTEKQEAGRTTYTYDIVTLSDEDSLTAVKYNGDVVELAKLSEIIKCNHKATETNRGIVIADTNYSLYFEGYTKSNATPKSLKQWDKKEWQRNHILSALSADNGYEGLLIGLTSRVDIDYRYIIDTFEAFVDSEIHSELSAIAKKKDNALFIGNFPAIKSFKDCEYTSFSDAKGNFQVKYIAEGGNKKKAPGVLFSLPTELNGASYSTFNTCLAFSDGTIKTVVPSAALVGNRFMDKYTSRQPYYIVAGPNYAKLMFKEMVGPDFNFARADLDVLEPMGVNAIVYVPTLGTFVNSNQTAKQNPVTALSKINVRELVIYLQDEIEKLMQKYQWDFNTPALRDKIKEKADYICERVKNNGGIEAFLNTCDTSNNTNERIENEFLVLSTAIEPGFGCGKMVQELTIYKRGGMSAVIK